MYETRVVALFSPVRPKTPFSTLPFWCFSPLAFETMNTGCVSPLISKQPAAFVNAANKRQGYTVIYKDEGGKHTRHYSLRLSLAQSTRKVSIAAYVRCNNPACPQHVNVQASPSFISDALFQVIACNRTGFRGPLHFCKSPVNKWAQKNHVSSYETSNDLAVEVECKFRKVSCKVSCPVCSGLTRYVVAVATDDDCVEETLPVQVKSKRKIPASMRHKSEREIIAYKAKTRHARTVADIKKEEKATNKRQRPNTPNAPVMSKRQKGSEEPSDDVTSAMMRRFMNMTDEEKVEFVREKHQHIEHLERKLVYQQGLLSFMSEQGAYRRKPDNFSADDCLPPLFGLSREEEHVVFLDTETHPLTVKTAMVPEPITAFSASIEEEDPLEHIEDLELQHWDLP